jgi:hypothetical protein
LLIGLTGIGSNSTTALTGTDLNVSGFMSFMDDGIMLFNTYEGDSGNLDENDRTNDIFIRYYDFDTDTVVFTDLITGGKHPTVDVLIPSSMSYSGSIIAYSILESTLGTDHNSDGDLSDSLVRYYDLSTQMMYETFVFGYNPSISGNIIAFSIPELSVNQDLNGDGQITNTDVVHYYDISTQQLTNTTVDGYEPQVQGDIIAFYDLNAPNFSGYINYYDITTAVLTQTSIAVYRPDPFVVSTRYRPAGRWRLQMSGSVIAYSSGPQTGGPQGSEVAQVGYYDTITDTDVLIGYGRFPSISGSIIVFETVENDAMVDLNNDGDMNDVIIQYYDMATQTITNTEVEGMGTSIFGSIISYQSCTCSSTKISYLDIAVSIPGISDTIDDMVIDGSIENSGIARSLAATLDQATAAIERGDTRTAIRMLNNFIIRVDAQAGINMTQEAADELIALAQAMLDSL